MLNEIAANITAIPLMSIFRNILKPSRFNMFRFDLAINRRSLGVGAREQTLSIDERRGPVFVVHDGLDKKESRYSTVRSLKLSSGPFMFSHCVLRIAVVSFIHLNRESPLDSSDAKGISCMVSNVGTASATGHGSASKIVIMVQSIIILSLSYWVVEEYLNNKYFGEYLNGVFQTDGLIIGALGTLLVLGSISSLVFLRRMHGEKKFGAVSLEVSSSTPKIKLAAEPKAKASETIAKPSADFHPVVAALKADMADRRMSFGSMASSSNDQSQTPSMTPTLGVQKASVLDQFGPNRQSMINSPTPLQTGAPAPQRTFSDPRPQVPTGQMPQPGALVSQRPMPLLRTQQPTGSTVLQPSQTPSPQIPANVTTVITGIMPVKKKDPSAPSEEKPTSSQ